MHAKYERWFSESKRRHHREHAINRAVKIVQDRKLSPVCSQPPAERYRRLRPDICNWTGRWKDYLRRHFERERSVKDRADQCVVNRRVLAVCILISLCKVADIWLLSRCQPLSKWLGQPTLDRRARACYAWEELTTEG